MAPPSLTRQVLAVAPTGVFLGRVKRGIDLVLATQSGAKGTKVRVLLVSDERWMSDGSYKTEFVEKLRDYVLATWKKTVGLDLVCDCEILPMTDVEYLTGWLLERLSAFFKSSGPEGTAFVDLTSAPKEWVFATTNVSNFFPRVRFYYVKSIREKKATEYSREEIEDAGLPKLEEIPAGYPVELLRRWIEPETDTEETNIPYLLFRTIFRSAQNIAAEKGLDSLEKAWVPIRDDRWLNEYRLGLEETQRTRLPRLDSDLMKSVSKHLTAVKSYNLFEEKPHSVRMTLRGAMLGQALFGEEIGPERHKRPSKGESDR